MPVITVRPNVSIQNGTWTLTGGTVLHTILSDNLDTTYISNVNKCRLPTEVAKIGIADISIPVGAKIFSVRTRVRVEKIATVGGVVGYTPQCILLFIQKVLEAALVGDRVRIYQLVAAFITPKSGSASTGWQTESLAYFTEQPSGGEWTQATFNAFEVNLCREGGGGTLKIGEVYVDVDYNERPVGTVTGPTGTLTDTTRPLITWTYADAESDRQQAYQVRIFSAAQYGAAGFDPLLSKPYTESGWLNGEDLSWTVNRDLVNDTYRAYVVVEQVWSGIGRHQSAPTFIGWTQAVPGPGQPTLNAVYEALLNRVRMDFARGPVPNAETINFEYSDNAGLDWGYVRGATQLAPDAAGNLTVYDYEAPLNRLRQYRTQAYRTLNTVKVASVFSATSSATPRSFNFWLKDPLFPSLNMVLPLSADSPTRPRSQGVFAPLVATGRTALKIAVSGPLHGREGEWELIFPLAAGDAAWTAFDVIRASGRVLLWQLPTGEQFYIALGADLSWEWGARADTTRWRRAQIGYTQTDTP